jgi:hypothetical protein
MADDIKSAGKPTIGDNIPFHNVSGETRVLGSTRHSMRGPDGRWKPRASRLVGPLGPAGGVGPGGVDSVTRRWISGVRDNSVKMSTDPINPDRIHQVGPDWSGYAPISAQLDDGSYPHHLRREA